MRVGIILIGDDLGHGGSIGQRSGNLGYGRAIRVSWGEVLGLGHGGESGQENNLKKIMMIGHLHSMSSEGCCISSVCNPNFWA
jgi:hypothetical protein